MTFFDRMNHSVATSKVGKYFRLDGSGARRERAGSKFTTEVRAGLTTFVAMVIPFFISPLSFSLSNDNHINNQPYNRSYTLPIPGN